MAMKVCNRCGPQPVSAFNKRSASRDGLQRTCRSCQKAYKTEWDTENAGHRKAYRIGRIDVITEQMKEWRLRPEVAQRESLRMRRVKEQRRAQMLAAYIEDVDALVVLELHDGVCGVCLEDVDPLNFHVDHITPLARGGDHSYANTQPAHPFCNRSKGARVGG